MDVFVTEFAKEHIKAFGYMLATGLIGGFCAHILGKHRESESRMRFQTRVLKSLRMEMMIIGDFQENLRVQLEKMPTNGFLEGKLFAGENNMRIYNAVCSQIGQIDPEISTKVIKFYSILSLHFETFQIHNDNLDEFIELNARQVPHHSYEEVQAAKRSVIATTQKIRNIHKVLKSLQNEIFSLMDKKKLHI